MKGSYLLFLLILLAPWSGLSQTVEEMDSVARKKGKVIAAPILGYSPESRFFGGFMGMWILPKKGVDTSSFKRPSTLAPIFIYTANKQVISSLRSEQYFKNATYLSNTLRVRNYPDFFFGIGNDTHPDDLEMFLDQFGQLNGRWMKIRDEKYFFGLSYDFRYDKLSDFEDGAVLKTGEVPGTGGGWTNGLGPIFIYDTRDNVLYPSKGWYVTSNLHYFSKVVGSNYSFGQLNIDSRYFREVISPKHVLGLQLVINSVAGNNIPFYRLPQLGGNDRLRGIKNENLYRDKVSWYFQVEGRRTLFWRLGGVLFAGVGNVSPGIASAFQTPVKAVVGAGGRFRPIKDQKLNLRLDFGVATDGFYAVYLNVAEAF
jgi:hypothetical protein